MSVKRRCIKCHCKVQDPSSVLCVACEDEALAKKFKRNSEAYSDYHGIIV